MEKEIKHRLKRNRRRERAERMQAQRDHGDSAEDETLSGVKPHRPPIRRKKAKEPIFDEDIIDGFAILAFRSYEELEIAVKMAKTKNTKYNVLGDDKIHSQGNIRLINRHSPALGNDVGTSDDSGRSSEVRPSGLPLGLRESSHDHLSDASSRCSSGRGYICDSEGEDDKNSDTESLFEAALSSTPRKCEIVEAKIVQTNIVMNGVGSSPCSGVLSSSSPTPPVPLLQPSKLTDNSRASVALSSFSAYLEKENDERTSKTRIENVELSTNKKSLLEINYEGFDKRLENNTLVESKKLESNTQQLKINNIDRILDDQLDFTEKEKSNRQLEKNALIDRSYLNSIHLEKSRTDGIPEHILDSSCVPTHLDKRTLNIVPHQIEKCLENSVHAKNIVDKKKDCSIMDKSRLEPEFPLTHNSVSNPLDSVLHNIDSSLPHLHNSSLSTNPNNTSHHQGINFGNASLKHLQNNHFYQNSVKTNLYNPVLPSYNGNILQFPTKKPFMLNTPNILPSNRASTTPTTSISSTTTCVTSLISSSNSVSPVINLPVSSAGIPNNLSTTLSLSNPVTISNSVSGLLQNTALHVVNHLPNQQRCSKESVILPIQGNALNGNNLRLTINSNQSVAHTLSPSSQHQIITSNLSASHVGSQAVQDCISAPKISGNSVSVCAANSIANVPISSLSTHSDLPTTSINSHSNLSLQPNTSSSGSLLSRVGTQESSSPGIHSGYSLPMPGTSFTGYPSLYGSYSSNLQHQSYLPPRVEPLGSTIASPISKQQSVLTGSVVSSTCTASATTTSTNVNNRDVPTTMSARRSLSPRGHSPSRERDSYSSNVSSLSRGSTTPVSRAPSASPFNPAASSSLSSSSPYMKNSVWMSTAGSTAVRASLHPTNFPPPIFAPPLPPPTGPTGPTPFSAESLFQTNQADLLRRELDTRFLASQDRSLGVTPAFLRTEMHHHQHQHTHVHQHQAPTLYPPPLFKEVPKLGGVDSPFYRGNLGLTNYPGFSPGLMGPGIASTPFAPPSHLNTFIPKQVGDSSKLRVVKTGKWNAMHVRVAWEIYHHQQKQTVENKSNLGGSGSKETLLRPSGHLFPSTASRLDLAGYNSSFLHPPPHIGAAVSPFGRYPSIGSFSASSPSSFPGITSFPSREMSALPPLSTVHDAWRLRGSSSFPIGPSSWSLKAEPSISERRELEEKEREREKERIRREKEEKEKDRERREREEKRKSEIERERKEKERRELERREQEKYLKIRDRSPIRNGDAKDDSVAVKEEDIVILGRAGPGGSYPPHSYNISRHSGLRPAPLTSHFTPSSWPPPPGSDPFAYRLDPLLRYNPLMSFRQEEEEQRAKLYGVGGYIPSHASHHQSSSPILLKKEESQSR